MGLQIWLPLDGNVIDQGLSDVLVENNNATISNSGKIGKCYNFDGSSSNLKFAYPATNFQGEWSFSCWVKPTDFTNHHTLLCSRKSAGYGIAIFILSGSGAIRFDNGTDNTMSQQTFETALTANTWQHLCLVQTATKRLLYIDGDLKEQITANSVSSGNTAENVFIGASSSNDSNANGNFLKGSLNDCRIYNHALSVKEIKELAKGLVLHYSLDNLINDTVYDCSGYLRHAIKTEDVVSSNNTPRYSSCSHFRDYDANIESSINLAFLNTGSCSFWAKVNIPGDMGFLPVAADSTHYFMATDLGNFSNQNIGTNTIKYYEDGVEVVKPTSFGVWHHYVITGINLSTWSTLKINNCTSTWNSPDVLYSDFRLYNTILSADDVKALYNDSASIDKNGNFHAYEYVEDDNIINIDINKQGVFTVPEEIMENSLKEPSIDDENIYAKGEFYED